jgi:endonuclease/exonuclease/phosphatase family metal-dependent hydrolase
LIFSVATYNIHACKGGNRLKNLGYIVQVLARCNLDIVAFQEIDPNRFGRNPLHQARLIAKELGMDFQPDPSGLEDQGPYANAVLSRHPMRLIREERLPGLPNYHFPVRSAIWVQVRIGEDIVQVINAHLGHHSQERLRQVEALLGPDWSGNPRCRPPLILCGDFNAGPHSAAYRLLDRSFHDVQRHWEAGRPKKTWPSRFPIRRIDHVFISADLSVRKIAVPQNPMARWASDHLPLVVELEKT